MKIKIYILALLSIILINSCGSPTDPQGIIINSKVKSETKWVCDPTTLFKSYKYSYKEYSSDGKLIKYIIFNDKGLLVSQSDISYQDNKSIETISLFDKTGNLNDTKLNTSIYDNTGKTITVVESSLNGEVIKKQDFVYDTKGNLVKRIDSKNNSKPIEITFTNLYNNDGQIVERFENLDLNGTFSVKDSIVYHSAENKIKKITTDNTGFILTVSTYSFNNFGKITSESISNSDGIVSQYFIYEYVYFK